MRAFIDAMVPGTGAPSPHCEPSVENAYAIHMAGVVAAQQIDHHN
jgi:hypothetical protein